LVTAIENVIFMAL